MNVYGCVSEELTYTEHILDDGSGPQVPYAIIVLIVAENRAKAKWLAWKTDRESFTGNIVDMPRFSVRRICRDVDIPVGEYVGERDEEYWERYEKIGEIMRIQALMV